MSENSFEKLLEENEIETLAKGKIIEGNVIRCEEDKIWVGAVGYAGDLIVMKDDLVKNISEYKKDDSITVKVRKTDDSTGTNFASERNALAEKLRKDIKEDMTVKIKILEKTNKGYKVLINEAVDAFLPGSLSMIRRDSSNYPKEELNAIVVGVRPRSIIVSVRDYMNKVVEKTFSEYKENMIVTGVVDSIKDFGAFIKLNKYVSALIPKSEISWDRSEKISDVLEVGDKVKGLIIRIDSEKRKISISLKQLKDNPWTDITDKYKVDSIVKGTVTQIFPFGFTVRLETGVDGLVHESEIFWNKKGKISDVASVGDLVEVKILSIDTDRKRISLSYKQALGNPWDTIDENYHENNIITGLVEKILPNGAIIKLEEGLTGFVHVSELSWNFIDNVENALSEGEKISVKILNIDKNTQRIKLSIKQAKENPWKKVSEDLKLDDKITGKISRYASSGAIILVDNYNVEAFLPCKKASVEKVSDIKEILSIGDTVEAKIIDIEFETEAKKGNMVVSISDLIKDTEKKEIEETMKKINEEDQ